MSLSPSFKLAPMSYLGTSDYKQGSYLRQTLSHPFLDYPLNLRKNVKIVNINHFTTLTVQSILQLDSNRYQNL